jgi:hypothetical protein
MIVMVSAIGGTSLFRGGAPSCRAARSPRGAPRAPAPGMALERAPRRPGRSRHDISPVDNDVPRVDDLLAQTFFLTHPVDDITAGNKGSRGASFGLVLNAVPSPRTGRAACLHRLSTGLCTARLDAGRGPQKTVRTGR